MAENANNIKSINNTTLPASMVQWYVNSENHYIRFYSGIFDDDLVHNVKISIETI